MDFVIAHYPFFVMAGVFWVIGHFMETSVFTRKRAHAEGKTQWLWWWGRESMELHPMIAGAVTGLIWRNPELADPAWPLMMNCAYFMGSGVTSLFGWLLATKVMEKLGLKGQLRFPGESMPPPSNGGK